MKALLILCALGVAASDKLDRTYLPPPGSITSGGDPRDLNLPFQLPKENYPSSFEPENETTNSTSGSKYPNIAIGIDREGPSVTESYTTRPVVNYPKNIFNFPTTTASYAPAQTSTLSVESYEATVGPVSTQGYPLSTPSIDYSNHQQSSSDQNIYSNGPQNTGRNFESNVLVPYGNPVFQAENVQQIRHDPTIGFVSGTGSPVSQFTNLDHSIASSALPEDFSSDKYPADKNRDYFVSTTEMTTPTGSTSRPEYNYNQQTSFNINPQEKSLYSTSEDSENDDDGKIPYTHNLQDPSKSSIPSVVTSSADYFSNNLNSPQKKVNERVQAEDDRNAVIVNYNNEIYRDGFAYSFDTSNKIHADESGTAVNGVKAQGSYSYIGDDGKLYNIVYTADENGFIPRGDHLPTAPPVPDAILRVIEQAARNKELGIIDDGSYDDAKYGHRRYHGLMDLPRNKFNKFNEKEPFYGKNVMNNTTDSFDGKVKPVVSGSDKKFDQLYIQDNVDITSRRPYYKNTGVTVSENINESNDDTKTFPSERTEVGKMYRGHDENQNSFTGYNYDQPKKIFNYNFESQLSKSYGVNDKPEYETIKDGRTEQHFMNPNEPLNFKQPDATLQISRENLYQPLTTSGQKSVFQPIFPTFYDKVSEKADRYTQKPESTASETYKYQTPSISLMNDNRQYNAPTSTLESQYISTTPLSTELPQSTFLAHGANSQSSPSSYHITSTPRASDTPELEGQVNDVRYPTKSPGFSVINENPRYYGNHKETINASKENQPIDSSQKGIGTHFDVPDTKFHTSKASSTPETYENSSTKRPVGEDFTGPNQPQGFDPVHGYYY